MTAMNLRNYDNSWYSPGRSVAWRSLWMFLGLPLFPGTSEYNQITRIVEMLGYDLIISNIIIYSNADRTCS